MNMPTRLSEFSAAAADYASNYAVGSPMWMNFYNEKFAELIMRECSCGAGRNSIRLRGVTMENWTAQQWAEYEQKVEAIMAEYGCDRSDAEGVVDVQLKEEV